MGASHPKYFNQKDAAELLGEARWRKALQQLERLAGKQVDIGAVSHIFTNQFESMPRVLCDCLFAPFVTDPRAKIDIADFLAGVVAIMADKHTTHNGVSIDEIHRKFLFQVYDYGRGGALRKESMLKILQLAYGKDQTEACEQQLSALFGDAISIDDEDFCSFEGDVSLLMGWVRICFGSLLDSQSPKLDELEKRYSPHYEVDRLVSLYNIPRESAEHLQRNFYARCQSFAKPEFTEEDWVDWVSGYIPPALSARIYRSKLTSMKRTWKFHEYCEFCMHFSVVDLAETARYLFEAFSMNDSGTVVVREALEMLSGIHTLDSDSKPEKRQRSRTLSRDAAMVLLDADSTAVATASEVDDWIRETKVAEEVDQAGFINLLVQLRERLLMLHRLEMCACCLMGVPPRTPARENAFVTELTANYELLHPRTRHEPYGPPGTEWCLVSIAWWNRWRFYVGTRDSGTSEPAPPAPSPSRHHGGLQLGGALATYSQRLLGRGHGPQSSSPSSSHAHIPHYPGKIDNTTILRRVGSSQMRADLVPQTHFMLLPPPVWSALVSWYGGGPRIGRTVIRKDRYELELYPVALRIVTCDMHGKTKGMESEMLFSKTLTIQGVIETVCRQRRIDPQCARLWDYARPTQWKEQHIVSPDLSLEEAKLQDGQLVMLEVSLNDGTWPRSQLQTTLENDERKSSDRLLDAKPAASAVSDDDGAPLANIGDGVVGLDNLGNTCYMNASLQCLLHTPPLIEYFLSKQHVRDVNMDNPLGHQGRLAHAFAALVREVWTANRISVTPKYFKQELGKFNVQFAGNEQHDAQELLAFLLDGLSEDLNRIHKKPYIENPDSDGRPDAELADIWWHNHLMREFSVIVALFTGQFRSIIVCSHCGYESARFEPFSFLQVPLPEDDQRTVIVHIVYKDPTAKPVQCSVRVPKNGVVADIATAVMDLNLPYLQECPNFIIANLLSSKVNSLIKYQKKLDAIKDGDNLFLYETEYVEDEQEDDASLAVTVTTNDATPTHSEIVSPPTSVGKLERSSSAGGSLPPAEEEASGLGPAGARGEDVAAVPPAATIEAAISTSMQESLASRVYVIMVQRRIRHFETAAQMQRFGVPLIDLLPRAITGRELYEMIAPRFQRVLKAPYSALPRTPEGNALLQREDIAPINNDDAVAGPVPLYGFVLRTVGPAAGSCSRCHWLRKCEGCLIPNTDILLDLQDCETIAIDWHYVVFQELVDLVETSEFERHVSLRENAALEERQLPLYQCVDKFTEQEKLDEMVCGKCHESSMKLTYALWRLPPILIVHLKRFQFTQYSRRKLHNLVDFPIDGLDMRKYMAPTRLKVLSNNREITSGMSSPVSLERSERKNGADGLAADDDEAKDNGVDGSQEEDIHVDGSEFLYDLYAVTHHLGALGGGHYVTSVRDWKTNKWKSFNDGLVSDVEPQDLLNPSAYILFYARRDLHNVSFRELFPEGTELQGLTVEQFEKLMQKRDNQCAIS